MSTTPGKPRIHKALEMANNKLFTESNGMRPSGVTKVLVSLLGEKVASHMNTLDTINTAQPLHDNDIKV